MKTIKFYDTRTPLDFASWAYDEKYKYYSWQRAISITLSQFADKGMLDFTLLTCSGAGKEFAVTVPASLWFSCFSKVSRCLIVSSSKSQLQQVSCHLKDLVAKNNIKCSKGGHGLEIFYTENSILIPKVNSRIHICLEEDKLDYRTLVKYSTGDLLVIIDEPDFIAQKTIDTLRELKPRLWLETATPRNNKGYLKERIKNSVEFFGYYHEGSSNYYRVTAYDCPHILREDIKNDKESYSSNSKMFKSKILAEFV